MAAAAEQVSETAAETLQQDAAFRLRGRMNGFHDGTLEVVKGLITQTRNDVVTHHWREKEEGAEDEEEEEEKWKLMVDFKMIGGGEGECKKKLER